MKKNSPLETIAKVFDYPAFEPDLRLARITDEKEQERRLNAFALAERVIEWLKLDGYYITEKPKEAVSIAGFITYICRSGPTCLKIIPEDGMAFQKGCPTCQVVLLNVPSSK